MVYSGGGWTVTDPAYIDDNPYPREPGERIITFLSRHLGKGRIPVLCHEKTLIPIGACRLCSVEVAASSDGPRRIQAACHTPVGPGMRIYPHTPRVERLRRNLLELLLADYPSERLAPAEGERPTPFQRLLARYGLTESRFPSRKAMVKPDESHPYIRFDSAECVHCYRCIRACDEVQGEFVLAMRGRGGSNRVIASTDGGFRESACVSCGRCVRSCPTNALSDRYRAKTRITQRRVRTVCTYCGVGCNLEVMVDGQTIRAIGAPKGAAVNHGHACVKGRYAFSYYNHPERLRSPLIRKDGELQPATWDEALDHIARHLGEIREQYGPDAIGGISSARCTNEENFLMQKFIRVVIGTNNIDGCARVCHAPTAFGMQQTFGAGAATNSIDEIDVTGCLLVIGANPTEAHPVTGSRIRQAAFGETPLIVIDPRVTNLARLATVHLQPRPGTNVALLNMLLYYVIDEGLVDHRFVQERTEGFDDFQPSVLGIDLDRMETVTGVSRGLVREAARIYAAAETAMAFHGLGVTEHYQGSRAVMLIAALAMLTGNIGRPGTGVNPLRGQNNVQGSADMGVQPNLGAGYLDLRDPAVQAHYRAQYGSEIPVGPGHTIPRMFRAARDGKLKALWVMGEDPMQTDPNSRAVKHSLKQLDFLVVQEIFMTETAACAHVVLPAASHFEKSGTFTNGERRVQRVNQVIEPLQGARPDGQIVVDIMNRMGYPQAGYDPAIHLQEIARVVPFFAGIRWDNLGENGRQWPVALDGADTKILHRDGFRNGRGRFRFTGFMETPELAEPDPDYPFILTTGRILAHYNCGTMTRRTPNVELVDRDVLVINPKDARAKCVTDGETVEVRSRRGATRLTAKVSDEVRPGVLFTSFHFPNVAINQLTSDVFDADSMTPEYKVTAVNLEPGNGG